MKRLILAAAAGASALLSSACLDFDGAKNSYCQERPDICGNGGYVPIGGTGGTGGGGTSGNCASLDPSGVYLHGTLHEGSAGQDALSTLLAPEKPCVGFTSYVFKGVIRPLDHRYLYLDWSVGNVYGFTQDKFVSTSGSPYGYPTDPLSNDTKISTPDCDGNVSTFFALPDSSDIIYSCGGKYYTSSGELTLSGLSIVAAGYGKSVLASDGFNVKVVKSDGTAIALNNGSINCIISWRCAPGAMGSSSRRTPTEA